MQAVEALAVLVSIILLVVSVVRTSSYTDRYVMTLFGKTHARKTLCLDTFILTVIIGLFLLGTIAALGALVEPNTAQTEQLRAQSGAKVMPVNACQTMNTIEDAVEVQMTPSHVQTPPTYDETTEGAKTRFSSSCQGTVEWF